jgi:hypothetical protein
MIGKIEFIDFKPLHLACLHYLCDCRLAIQTAKSIIVKDPSSFHHYNSVISVVEREEPLKIGEMSSSDFSQLQHWQYFLLMRDSSSHLVEIKAKFVKKKQDTAKKFGTPTFSLCAWSEPLSHFSGPLLLCAQTDYRLLLYEPPNRSPLSDLFPHLQNHFITNANTKVEANEYLQNCRAVTVTAMSWCPSLCEIVNSVNECDAFLLLALGNKIGNITIWKLSLKESCQKLSEQSIEWKIMASLTQGSSSITSCHWTIFDGKCYLATGSSDGSIFIWLVEFLSDSGSHPQSLRVTEIQRFIDSVYPNFLSWAPHSGCLFVARGCLLQCLDVFDSKFAPYTVVAHYHSISQLSWDNTGTFLVTSSLDGILKVWRVNTNVRSKSNNKERNEKTRDNYYGNPNTDNENTDVKMVVEGEPLQQLVQIDLRNLVDIEPDGIYGALVSPNALFITTLIRTLSGEGGIQKPKALLFSVSISNKIRTLEEVISAIIQSPSPVTYWDLLKVLHNNLPEVSRLVIYVENTYFHNKEYRERSLKVATVLLEHFQASKQSDDERKIVEYRNEIRQYYLQRVISCFFTDHEKGLTQLKDDEKKALATMCQWLEENETYLKESKLKELKSKLQNFLSSNGIALQKLACPLCSEELNVDWSCRRKHPVQWCSRTFRLVTNLPLTSSNSYLLICGTCRSLCYNLNIESGFNWIKAATPCLRSCPQCDSFLVPFSASHF